MTKIVVLSLLRVKLIQFPVKKETAAQRHRSPQGTGKFMSAKSPTPLAAMAYPTADRIRERG